MVVLVKAIKAPRLQSDAMRLVLLNAMRKAGRYLVKTDFKQTTRTWKHKVEFEILVSLKPPGPTILIGTDNQIWNWINEGTNVGKPPYPIFAGIYTGKSNKKALAFPSRFKPKTKRGTLKSGGGFKGGPTTVVPYVEHPGIKPREWTKLIAKKRTLWFKRQMERAMQEAALVSGHSVRSA